MIVTRTPIEIAVQQMNRRQFMGVFATPLFVTQAQAKEPFPVFASDADLVEYKFRKREVNYQSSEPVGTIVVDSKNKLLYFILGNLR